MNIPIRNSTYPRRTRLFGGPVTVTLALPIRVEAESSFRLPRLANAAEAVIHGLDVLVVDDGSPEPYASLIQERCAQLGYRYVFINSCDDMFSIARARNRAAIESTSRYLLFQDVDVVPSTRFFELLRCEIDVQGLDKAIEDFLMFAWIYLSAEGTRAFRDEDRSTRDSRVIEWVLRNDKRMVEQFSSGTSSVLVNRLHYMAIGGNDEAFRGWGYEDIEFNLRAISANRAFPEPKKTYIDQGSMSEQFTYEGWKSRYRLYGDRTFAKGMFYVHEFHPVDPDHRYSAQRFANKRRFERLAAQRRVSRESWPEPLPARNRAYVALRSNAFTNHPVLTTVLGKRFDRADRDFANADEFFDWCCANNVDLALFFNPYESDRMLELYRACRARAFPYLVAERGAFPGSMFFDGGGFLNDSASYAPERWDRPLSPEEREQVLGFVETQTAGSDALEPQSERIGGEMLRQKFGVITGEKLLFIPLQRLNDTVTRHFAGPIGGYDAFLDLVRETAESLRPDWKMVIKAHPLEDWSVNIPGAFNADDTHINDLLDACDGVLTFNSGTGALALMWGDKPVLCAGEAFYAHEGLARHTPDIQKVLGALAKPWPDPERRLRFIHYLAFRFYSFGKFHTRATRMEDGARMTATTSIDFRVVRGVHPEPIFFASRTKPDIDENSILFDRYRHWFGVTGVATHAKIGRVGRIRLPRSKRFAIEARKFLDILAGRRPLTPRRWRHAAGSWSLEWRRCDGAGDPRSNDGSD